MNFMMIHKRRWWIGDLKFIVWTKVGSSWIKLAAFINEGDAQEYLQSQSQLHGMSVHLIRGKYYGFKL